MNHSNAERGAVNAEVKSSDQVLINYSFELPVLPPVHPKCKFFSIARVLAHSEKLKQADDAAGLKRLAEALEKVAAHKVQGAWHSFAPGIIDHTHIIPPRNILRLNGLQMAKCGLCVCEYCVKQRRG